MRSNVFRPLQRVLVALAAAVLVSGAGSARPPTSPAPLARAVPTAQDTARALHLLNRATYGARPNDLETVLRMGRAAWLDRQLHPERIDDAALEARLEPYAAARMTPAELLRAYPPPAAARAVVLGETPDPRRPQRAPDALTPEQRQQLNAMNPARILPVLAGTKLVRAVYSERQLEEVMTDFWFNHFNVFFNKNDTRYAVADYERNAIRPHVFGRFEEMLLATARHPAMLIYLDNFLSTAPSPPLPLGRRSGRPAQPSRGGLNENYARELLELHTLGVNGGYTQDDVVNVARAFTGWTVSRPRQPAMLAGAAGGRLAVPDDALTFQFRRELHDREPKEVLGLRLRSGRGLEDGLDVLRLVARHPATADHIAEKLVRHFVADDPPPDLVREIARVFRETGGDLREVTRALFTAEAFYEPEAYRGKVKRPFEFVASALRVTGAEVNQPQPLVQQLRAFGHMPYAESAPTGYPVTQEEWVSAGAMLSRINFAMGLGAGRAGGVRIQPLALVDQDFTRLRGRAPPIHAAGAPDALDPLPPKTLAAAVVRGVLPGVAAPELEAAIQEEIRALDAAAPREAAARALGLALGSPHFQRY